MYDLKQIQTRAMELYRKHGVLPPDHLRQSMKEAGVPEDDMWDVREDLRKLEEPAPQPIEPKKHKKKVVTAPSGPPQINWHGKMTLRGHEINLEELNQRDHKRAAAHDED